MSVIQIKGLTKPDEKKMRAIAERVQEGETLGRVLKSMKLNLSWYARRRQLAIDMGIPLDIRAGRKKANTVYNIQVPTQVPTTNPERFCLVFVTSNKSTITEVLSAIRGLE